MVEVKKIHEIFRCQICGNITEVITVGGGEMFCCGEPMERLIEKSQDEGQEKHIPIVESKGSGVYQVIVGEVNHPMEENHFIEWIDFFVDGRFYQRSFLKPGEAPVTSFSVSFNHNNVQAREFCNIHGLWISNKKTIDINS